jgi:hypothetical protein
LQTVEDIGVDGVDNPATDVQASGARGLGGLPFTALPVRLWRDPALAETRTAPPPEPGPPGPFGWPRVSAKPARAWLAKAGFSESPKAWLANLKRKNLVTVVGAVVACVAVVATLAVLGGEETSVRRPIRDSSDDAGALPEVATSFPTPEPYTGPAATGLPAPSAVELAPPAPSPNPGSSKKASGPGSAAKLPAAPPAPGHKPACRNSTDPACGAFGWDPAPAPEQPAQITVTWTPAAPKKGEPVVFTVSVTDPDAAVTDCWGFAIAGAAAACQMPQGFPARYGPWTPPAAVPGAKTFTFQHTFGAAGTYEGTVTVVTAAEGFFADPIDPYGEVATVQFSVPVSG